MTAYAPNNKETTREQAVLNDWIYQKASTEILALVRRLRTATADQEFFALHRDLLIAMRARQDLVVWVRKDIADDKLQIAAILATEPRDMDALRAAQQRLAIREHQERVQDAIRHVLLAIGDGIAWKRTRYDRAAITALGQGQRVAWLSTGDGLNAELAALDSQWEQGHFALLADMTTCIRQGDLVVFQPGQNVVLEVKATAGANRSQTQSQRQTEATALINDGEGRLGGVKARIERCPVSYRTFLRDVPALLQRARKHGVAHMQPSPCQLVVAHDLRQYTRQNGRETLTTTEMVALARWSEDDLLMRSGTSLRRMRDRHHSFATFAPISIYPLPERDIADLLTGYLDVTGWVNVSALARRLRQAGYEVEEHGPPESANAFLTVSVVHGDQQLNCTVSPHMREMMMLELMTPANVHAAIDHLMGLLRTATDMDVRRSVFMADEHRVWDSAV